MGTANDVWAIPYWHVNVPEDERTELCPDFLAQLSDKDRGIISTPDAAFRADTWPEVRRKVADNRIDLFRRVPSELRRYLAYNWMLKKKYGSILNFVLAERLRWTEPVVASAAPFRCSDDIKILWNDWPYGIDERIVHLVVWTKFDLEEDPATGDLSDRARAEIDTFVLRTFLPRVPRENFVWFKNWRSLKSVHAVEHFHVMLFDPDSEFIREITNDDVPLCRKVGG